MKTVCDPMVKHMGKLAVTFINVVTTPISQQPIGTSSVQNLRIAPTGY